jgi:rsbT co-antagonist protein RsbR
VKSLLAELVKTHERAILDDWWRNLTASGLRRDLLMKEAELREQCAEFLRLLAEALSSGGRSDFSGAAWVPMRDLLSHLSRTRGQQGFTPSETASFIFSAKQPLFSRLREALSQDAGRLGGELWEVTELIDRMGLFTTEEHQRAREEVIRRQQEDMLELSTPVVQLWEGVLALPLIGTLDSGRTQTVMESLLKRIVETEAEIAIIDITGVPTVDTLTAQHLLKTVTATRLMGAECIISGIRPQIAQTIVHLGVNLSGVLTKATLQGAFQLALQRRGLSVGSGTHPGKG